MKMLFFVMIVALEILFGLFFIYMIYPMFSMLAFGEGAGSFMYSTTNGILMFLIPCVLTGIVNFIQAREHMVRGDMKKANLYYSALISLLIFYPILAIWLWGF